VSLGIALLARQKLFLDPIKQKFVSKSQVLDQHHLVLASD
jgi:hypothetical protein